MATSNNKLTVLLSAILSQIIVTISYNTCSAHAAFHISPSSSKARTKPIILTYSSSNNKNAIIDDDDNVSVPNSNETKKNKTTTTTKTKKTRPRIPIITYRDNWVCVNKPAGLTVHRSRGTPKNRFVLSTLLKRQLARKVYPVHRLDHRTSGAILFAFNSETCAQLHDSLRSSTAVKDYVALLRGDWNDHFREDEIVTIDKPLVVDGASKEATTEFSLLASHPGRGDPTTWGVVNGVVPACSLVRCRPKTGRTHQIRRHAYALGHPVLGDTEHGDTKVNRWWRVNKNLDRLALHCLSIDVPDILSTDDDDDDDDDDDGGSSSKGRIQCVAPLSSELAHVFKSIDNDDDDDDGGQISWWERALQKEPRLILEPVDERGGSLGRFYGRRRCAEMELTNS